MKIPGDRANFPYLSVLGEDILKMLPIHFFFFFTVGDYHKQDFLVVVKLKTYKQSMSYEHCNCFIILDLFHSLSREEEKK